MSDKTKLLVTPLKEQAEAAKRSACLVHIYPSGAAMGKRYALSETEGASLSLGRDETCDICIEDAAASRRHAIIQVEADGYYVIDLQSTNGSFVNNERVTRCKLKDGDHFGVGTCIYHFLTGDNLEAAYYEEIYKLAIIDALTETYNKRYLMDYLRRALASAGRNRRPLALVMFDIDFFKSINDKMGHLAGDYTLRELAALIKTCIRKQDLFARYGGEEFTLVLPETGQKEALGMAERLRCQVMSHPFQFANNAFQLTVSLGVRALSGEESLSCESLLKEADAKLYQAKKAGRNRVVG